MAHKGTHNPDHLAKLLEGREAWNAWRKANPDIVPSLSGIDLSAPDNIPEELAGKYPTTGKRCSDLSDADLCEANLSCACLIRVKLSGATLRSSNLSGADLRGARLSDARLLYANLSGADLWNADLSRASLPRADLRQARLHLTDLENAKVPDVQYRGGSILDVVYDFFCWIFPREWTFTSDEEPPRFETAEAAFLGRLEPFKKCPPRFKRDMMRMSFRRQFPSGKILSRFETDVASLPRWQFWRVFGYLWRHRGLGMMRGCYQGINAAECYGNTFFRRDAMDQDYIDSFCARHPKWGWVWGVFTDYGRSLFRIFLLSLAIIGLFGLFYKFHSVPYQTPLPPVPIIHTQNIGIDNGFTPFYVAAVTFSTLGFADLVTAGSFLGQAMLVLNAACGYIIFGLLMSVLANVIARRAGG